MVLIENFFIELFTVLGLGFVIGLKHAFEADHVVAVSAIVQKHKSLKKASLVGIIWGLGHTTTLFLMGLLLLTLKVTIPEKISLSMEFIVGVVIVLLGISVLKDLFIDKKHFHIHKHNKKNHAHYHSHKKTKAHKNHYHKPFLIGLVHGVAGSAALMLLVLSTIESIPLGLLYIIIFGFGSVIGMGIVSIFLGLPFKLANKTSNLWNKRIRFLTGYISVLFGLFIMFEVGFVSKLFV